MDWRIRSAWSWSLEVHVFGAVSLIGREVTLIGLLHSGGFPLNGVWIGGFWFNFSVHISSCPGYKVWGQGRWLRPSIRAAYSTNLVKRQIRFGGGSMTRFLNLYRLKDLNTSTWTRQCFLYIARTAQYRSMFCNKKSGLTVANTFKRYPRWCCSIEV